jgi:hypothetical protein
MWLEIVIFFAVAIFHIVKFTKFWKKGFKLKQLKLLGYGQAAILIGIFVGIGLPEIMGIQGNFSINAEWTYLLLNMVGICIFIIGLRFTLASYRLKEETPNWIKQILRFAKEY